MKYLSKWPKIKGEKKKRPIINWPWQFLKANTKIHKMPVKIKPTNSPMPLEK